MSKSVNIPTELVIEHGALRHLPQTEVFTWLTGRRVAVICGNGRTKHVAEDFAAQIAPAAKRVTVLTCADHALDTINVLEKDVLKASADIVIGVGGGKALDVAKVIGTRTGLTVVLMPTAVSNDAICSPVAVIRTDKKTSIGVNMPRGVIIDLDILVSCPERLVKAGIGDLLSNRTALTDWDLAHRAGRDTMNTFARLVANNAVEAFMNTISHRSYDRSALMKVLAESLVMSGIAMSIAGSSRPCSGAEHLISHALDAYCGGRALHGEQVAVGTLIADYLQGGSRSEESLRHRFASLGLPLHYAAIGYSREEMALAIRMAPTMRERYTVLNEFTLTDSQIDEILDNVFSLGENNAC